jgi:hypothetical protein
MLFCIHRPIENAIIDVEYSFIPDHCSRVFPQVVKRNRRETRTKDKSSHPYSSRSPLDQIEKIALIIRMSLKKIVGADAAIPMWSLNPAKAKIVVAGPAALTM